MSNRICTVLMFYAVVSYSALADTHYKPLEDNTYIDPVNNVYIYISK